MGRLQRYDKVETLKKATDIFWRNGFSGTSMRDLENHLDMRPGSIYASFGNKESFYMQAMDFYAARNFNDFKEYMKNAENFMAGLGQFIEQILLDNQKSGTCMLAKTISDISPDSDKLRTKAILMISSFEDIIVTELSRARENGEINQNCDMRSLARYIQVQILGLRSYSEMKKEPEEILELLQDVLTSIKAKAVAVACHNDKKT
ncbi:Transcriptional regulator, AcrR family [hydrothermal vent metagenome]|uniref:Transcriptional regulator, AcrR family n=1 Tax=hydrothermal vent metagenome TaxID=652676 RepID=A0A3B0R5V0_9ZZZZ